MERVMGIEPTQPAWKAGTLPLSYTRSKLLNLTINQNYLIHYIVY